MRVWITNPLCTGLYSLVYHRWLRDYKIIAVRGWRTMTVEDRRGGGRRTITACFWGLD